MLATSSASLGQAFVGCGTRSPAAVSQRERAGGSFRFRATDSRFSKTGEAPSLAPGVDRLGPIVAGRHLPVGAARQTPWLVLLATRIGSSKVGTSSPASSRSKAVCQPFDERANFVLNTENKGKYRDSTRSAIAGRTPPASRNGFPFVWSFVHRGSSTADSMKRWSERRVLSGVARGIEREREAGGRIGAPPHHRPAQPQDRRPGRQLERDLPRETHGRRLGREQEDAPLREVAGHQEDLAQRVLVGRLEPHPRARGRAPVRRARAGSTVCRV